MYIEITDEQVEKIMVTELRNLVLERLYLDQVTSGLTEDSIIKFKQGDWVSSNKNTTSDVLGAAKILLGLYGVEGVDYDTDTNYCYEDCMGEID